MSDDKPIRLSKYMSQLGLCSRREADQYIEKGWVLVNGEVVNTLGFKVLPPVDVELSSKAKQTQDSKLTVALYKPLGYVSGPKDLQYPSALDLIQEKSRSKYCKGPKLRVDLKKGMAPAGRLDVDTTGLLILTSAGPVVKTLIGPESDVEKEYVIRTEVKPTENQIERLSNGTLMIDEFKVSPAECFWNGKTEKLHLILKEGKKRQVRKMCEAVELPLKALRRVRIGHINLKGLKPGEWRHITEKELQGFH